MRKILVLLTALLSISSAYAENTANINIRIKGAHNNTYFLCIPDIGCLSILAASKGKTFQMMHSIDMNTLFVTDTSTMAVYNQGLPTSCDVSVAPNQTITIYGRLQKQGDNVVVNHLRCKVSS